MDYQTSIASKEAFAQLIAENEELRPLLCKASDDGDQFVYLEFTPNFMNLMRVGKHGPHYPKIFYHELYKQISEAKSANNKFLQRQYSKYILRQMQAFSKHAVRAEELLRQGSDIDMTKLSDEEADILLEHTLEMFMDVEKYIGAEALEREGYLFVHVTALKSMKLLDFH